MNLREKWKTLDKRKWLSNGLILLYLFVLFAMIILILGEFPN